MVDRWDRYATLTGAAAAVLWVVAMFVREGMTNTVEASAAEPERVLGWFQGDTAGILVSALLFFGAALLFLWFMASVRIAAIAAEGTAGRLTALIFGNGLATAVLFFAFVAPDIAGAIAASEDRLTAESAHALSIVGTGFFVAAEFTLAALFIASALLSFRRTFLPRWLAWTNVVLAVLLFIPPIGWAVVVVLFPLWLVVLSVLLYRQTEETAPPGEPAAAGPPAT